VSTLSGFKVMIQNVHAQFVILYFWIISKTNNKH